MKDAVKAVSQVEARAMRKCSCGGKLQIYDVRAMTTDKVFGVPHVKRVRICRSCGTKSRTREFMEADIMSYVMQDRARMVVEFMEKLTAQIKARFRQEGRI